MFGDRSRGALIFIDDASEEIVIITEDMREGVDSFTFIV